MIRVKMIYFAQAREAAGTKGEEFSLDEKSSVRTALSKAFEAHPRLRPLEKAIKVAVNEEITQEDARLKEGDRVALLPPVVGG
jgi:molybdopterin converting factor subunit 1